MTELLVATTNKKKKKELVRLLKGLDVKILTLADFKNIPKIKEDKNTFEGNAAKKAVVTSRYAGKLTLAEDSGIEVDALGGLPGVYSARFAGAAQDDEANNKKLLLKLEKTPFYKRRARFVCCAALAENGKLIEVIRGSVSGYISFEPKGKNGFGYDPLFYYPSLDRNFGQLPPSVKNKLSHRYKALRKMRKVIRKALQISP